tara:strand:- start:2516 stop:2728 length:213 start_codon:yes stop_codon:yes gene_type:complete
MAAVAPAAGKDTMIRPATFTRCQEKLLTFKGIAVEPRLQWRKAICPAGAAAMLEWEGLRPLRSAATLGQE